MNYATLESRAAGADALGRTMLGHAITITIAGTAYPVQAQGNYEDGSIATGASTGIVQQIELMVLKTDLPTRPGRGHRVVTPRRAGLLFEPVNVQDDDTGRHWLFNLKQVAA